MTDNKFNIDPLLNKEECAKLLRVSLPTLYRLIASGTFPKPIKFGQSSRWAKSEVVEALERAKLNREAQP